MNYSTSFLDLCSCALGGLLLLMFLLVPQTKPKAFDIGGFKPSLTVECHYPVYTDNFNFPSESVLPLSVETITEVAVALSNDLKYTFKNNNNESLWSSQSETSPAPIVKYMDDGSVWTLTIDYRQGSETSPGEVSVCASIELNDDDLAELQAAMIVQFSKKEEMYKNIIVAPDKSKEIKDTTLSDDKYYQTFIDNRTKSIIFWNGNFDNVNELYDNLSAKVSLFTSNSSDEANIASQEVSGIERSTENVKGYKFPCREISEIILDKKMLKWYNKITNNDYYSSRVGFLSNHSICYISTKINSNDVIIFKDVNYYMPRCKQIVGKNKFIIQNNNVDFAFRWCPPNTSTKQNGFWIMETEVTQKQWKAFMGNVPGKNKDDNLPVEYVSWDDCKEFCNRTGLRLPTVSQWKYACYADGSINPQNEEQLRNIAWYGTGPDIKLSFQKGFWGGIHILHNDAPPYPVRKKEPNAWGIYDMYGNVCEWCKKDENQMINGVLLGGCRFSTKDDLKNILEKINEPLGCSHYGLRCILAP